MQIQKLFNVLVIGGAMLSAGAIANNTSFDEIGADSIEAADLAPAFCDPKDADTCVTTACGKKQVKAGFECCWGTSCDDVQP